MLIINSLSSLVSFPSGSPSPLLSTKSLGIQHSPFLALQTTATVRNSTPKFPRGTQECGSPSTIATGMWKQHPSHPTAHPQEPKPTPSMSDWHKNKIRMCEDHMSCAENGNNTTKTGTPQRRPHVQKPLSSSLKMNCQTSSQDDNLNLPVLRCPQTVLSSSNVLKVAPSALSLQAPSL